MTHLVQHLEQLWPWVILWTALAIGWAGQRHAAYIIASLWVGIALSLGILSPIALVALIPGLALAAWLRQAQGTMAGLGWGALILWSVAMAAHLLPGFNNPVVLDQVLTGPDSRPFTLHLNADKPMVFFALLLAWQPLLIQDSSLRVRPLVVAVALAVALFPLALVAGALQVEPSLPSWTLLFILTNLLMTCLTEEAFFRGFLQKALIARVSVTAGIATTSVLFGLVHAPAGLAVVVFATLLGAACGMAHWFGGRLRYAVWVHFGFNLTHLLLFTYPGPI